MRLRLAEARLDTPYENHYENHIPAKLRSICNPTRWLFSGWNCVAKTFSRQITDVNGSG